LRLKLALMFFGAPTALAATHLGPSWLFYCGLALLILALILPTESEQSLGKRLKNVARHLPGARWMRPRE
jgi:hypothetical protein